MIGIKMQEMKVHKFLENCILLWSIDDILIANLMSISGADGLENKYTINKGPKWLGFDLQPLKVVSTF